jgi:acetylornithine deacetylase/succinyl-diaminopimelate desuccinylase-like protein
MHMLASLTSPDGNTPLIKGFFEGKEEPTKDQIAQMKEQAKSMDLVRQAQSAGVARFMSDDPYQVLYDGRFGTSFNLDGIWGGNMYAGGAGAILPNKITSKHNFRYVPKMMGPDIVKKLRAQLDANGYKDVEVKLIGDVPWSRGSSMDTDITHAHQQAAAMLGLRAGGGRFGGGGGGGNQTAPRAPDAPTEAAPTGGYWPSYLFSDGEVGQKVGTVSIPMGMGGGGGGGGGRAHAANEYYVVEAQGWQGGMATAEKNAVATIYEYARTTTVAPKPKTTAGTQ